MPPTMIRRVLSMWVAVTWLPLLAHAASFDCRQAASPAEKAICSNPVLGSLDEQIATAYADVLAKPIDPRVVAEIRDNQRAWMKGRVFTNVPAMETTMHARLQELRHGERKVNTLTFLALGETGDRPMYLITPTPGTAAYNRWAILQRKDADSSEACQAACSQSVRHTFRLNFASSALISVSVGNWVSAGLAEPEDTVQHNWLLEEGRELRPTDLFVGTAWRAVVEQTVASDSGDASTPDLRAGLVKAALEPANWIVTGTGLRIAINPVDLMGLGFGTDGCVDFFIPWARFRGALNDALIDKLLPYRMQGEQGNDGCPGQ